jgi:hypothetical protein
MILEYDLIIVPAPKLETNLPNQTEDVTFGKAHNYLIQNYVVELISKIIKKKHIISAQQRE